MADIITTRMNELLVNIFQSVLKVEEQQIRNSDFDLSISELHVLEAIGACGEEGSTCSALAEALGVSMPTITVAIKRLEAREYVVKTRSEVDGRKIHIVLTRKGHRADIAHRYFHRQMVRALLSDASDADKPLLLQSLENLNSFLSEQLAKPDGKVI